MNKNISSRRISLILCSLVFCFAAAMYVVAWTEPSQGPPSDNIAAPINIGDVTQYKSGALGIKGVFETDTETHLAVSGGNVGIGDTSPDSGTGGQLKLDVEGPIGATKYCDENGNHCTVAGELFGGLGAWENKSFNTVYHASTDGLVIAWIDYSSWPEMYGYTGKDEWRVRYNNPSVLRLREGPDDDGARRQSITLPVRRGDYWKIRLTGSASDSGLFWIPLSVKAGSCPSETVEIYNGLCIDDHWRSAATMPIAADNCYFQGGHVCTYGELTAACKNAVAGCGAGDVNGKWIGNVCGDDCALCGNGVDSCDNFEGTCDKDDNRQYKCCYGSVGGSY